MVLHIPPPRYYIYAHGEENLSLLNDKFFYRKVMDTAIMSGRKIIVATSISLSIQGEKRRKQEQAERSIGTSMCLWSHYRFRTYLRVVMGDRAVVCGEHCTFETCGKCGRINHHLNSSKIFICRFEGYGFRDDRDVIAWRKIVMKNFIAGLACAWKHTGMWPPSHANVGKDLPEGVETA